MMGRKTKTFPYLVHWKSLIKKIHELYILLKSITYKWSCIELILNKVLLKNVGLLLKMNNGLIIIIKIIIFVYICIRYCYQINMYHYYHYIYSSINQVI